MATVNLRRIGDSVVLAVQPALAAFQLDRMNLRAGVEVRVEVENGRLVVAPAARPSYALDELLAQCDETAPPDAEDRAWLDAKPVGNELL